MFDKVLLLSASAGAGHVRAAQALEKAFLELKAAREVKSIDVLDCTNRLVRRAYSRGYVVWVQKHPHVWGMVYDHLDIPGKWEHRRLALERLFFRHFLAMLQDERPDLIVCTHFLPPELVSWLKGKGLLDCPQAIVTTDLDIHGMWLCRHFEHYFVSLEESREYLVKLGVPREKVTVSGIPVDPERPRGPVQKTRTEARRHDHPHLGRRVRHGPGREDDPDTAVTRTPGADHPHLREERGVETAD